MISLSSVSITGVYREHYTFQLCELYKIGGTIISVLNLFSLEYLCGIGTWLPISPSMSLSSASANSAVSNTSLALTAVTYRLDGH